MISLPVKPFSDPEGTRCRDEGDCIVYMWGEEPHKAGGTMGSNGGPLLTLVLTRSALKIRLKIKVIPET